MKKTKPILLKDLGRMYPTPTSKQKYRYGIFKCYCGKEFKAEIRKKACVNKSCGCLNFLGNSNRTHGLSKHRLYTVWHDMMRRCYNKNSSEYKRYGAIGVKVSKEWHNVKTFIDDMSHTFKEGLSLDKDKICKEKNIFPHIYSKETCLWASKTEQVRRTRKLNIKNTSGYRGVIEIKNKRRFISRIRVNNKAISLGYFKCRLAAAYAYDTYIKENNLEHTTNF